MSAYMEYVHEESGITARWHGGAYIDLGYVAAEDQGFVASDVINVWDYANDEPTIPRTLDALEQAVNEWWMNEE
jgi:hypothetical protein